MPLSVLLLLLLVLQLMQPAVSDRVVAINMGIELEAMFAHSYSWSHSLLSLLLLLLPVLFFHAAVQEG